MKLLIDGDLLLYTCGFAIEGNHYVSSDDVMHHKYRDALRHCEENNLDPDWIVNIGRSIEPVHHGLHLMKKAITRCQDKYPEATTKLFVSAKDSKNYRREISTETVYKGNRTAGKPYHFDAMREYLINKYSAEEVDGIEVDDALGIAQDKATNTTVICSLDKDMLMIPGKHYNWRKDLERDISQLEGLKNFYTQLLTGDRTDNIKGLEGIGPKKAAKLLAKATTEEEAFEVVYSMYEQYGDLSRLLERGKLLWIQQNKDEIWPINPNIKEKFT